MFLLLKYFALSMKEDALLVKMYSKICTSECFFLWIVICTFEKFISNQDIKLIQTF